MHYQHLFVDYPGKYYYRPWDAVQVGDYGNLIFMLIHPVGQKIPPMEGPTEEPEHNKINRRTESSRALWAAQSWLTHAPDPWLTIGYLHYNDTYFAIGLVLRIW